MHLKEPTVLCSWAILKYTISFICSWFEKQYLPFRFVCHDKGSCGKCINYLDLCRFPEALLKSSPSPTPQSTMDPLVLGSRFLILDLWSLLRKLPFRVSYNVSRFIASLRKTFYLGGFAKKNIYPLYGV